MRDAPAKKMTGVIGTAAMTVVETTAVARGPGHLPTADTETATATATVIAIPSAVESAL